MNGQPTATATIGIDLGGTKIAAGLVVVASGQVLARRLTASRPERGGDAVLADVIAIAKSLQQTAEATGITCEAIGIGIAELVSPSGEIASEATFPWRSLDVMGQLNAALQIPVRLEADVRAAALGEACVGAGRGIKDFLYVTVGTGISACLVLNGRPYAGARGLTGTFASSPVTIPTDDGQLVQGVPLEQFAGGPGIAKRYSALHPDFRGSSAEVAALARAGDNSARSIIENAGRALGAAVGQLVNTLDPLIVILGGGLGVSDGPFREAIAAGLKGAVWADAHRDIPLLTAQLEADAGFIGAALAAHPAAPSAGVPQVVSQPT